MIFKDIVYISNEIRFVLNTARQVTLAAQNASLAARRAGNARGFQAVSVELKNFSHELANAMDNMSTEILAIAHAVSAAYRQSLAAQYFQNTVSRVSNKDVIFDAVERVTNRRDQGRADVEDRVQQLGLQLARSIRHCGNGRTLARSALIESTSGGNAEGMLRNVAQDIERTIEEIFVRLKLIGAQLQKNKG